MTITVLMCLSCTTTTRSSSSLGKCNLFGPCTTKLLPVWFYYPETSGNTSTVPQAPPFRLHGMAIITARPGFFHPNVHI